MSMNENQSISVTVSEKKITKPKRLFKYLDQTKVNEMLERARNDNKRNYLILLTLVRTGLRNSELIHLKKKDIDIKEECIWVRQGKGYKDRLIPLDTVLGDLLMYHCADMTNEDVLFPLSDMQIRNITHKYQGSEDVHPHTFRHSFAVHCLRSGMNIRVLQRILGHNDLATTAMYLDLIAQDIKDEYRKVKW